MRRALKAEELINFDVHDFENGKETISGLLKSLAGESDSVKARIANELIEIVVNEHERVAKRSQAAFLLGSSFRSLEISGLVQITKCLVRTLELEFMGTFKQRTNDFRKQSTIRADGLRLVLLQSLVFSTLAINPKLGKAITTELLGRIEGDQIREWLEKVSECAG